MSGNTNSSELVESELDATNETGGAENLKWKIALEPFNRSDADITFRTLDGVEFRLHKQILVISSPVLDEIIKYAVTSEEHNGIEVSVPIVDVSETSKTLDSLFRYCYPVVEPKPGTLEDIACILHPATKYGVKAAIDPLRDNLLGFIVVAPVRVYAIACRNNMEYVAREAAVVAVGGTFLEYDCPELESIPADVYWKLLVFYRNFHLPDCQLQWRSIPTVDTPISTQISRASSPFDGASGDVIIQSADGVQFQLHKFILSIASPFFQDMFTLPQAETEEDDISIIPVSESSSTLDHLFRFIYPLDDFEAESQDLCLINDVLAAAIKYDMQKPLSIIKRCLPSRARKSPITVFLIACRHGFPDVAKAAASITLRRPALLERTESGSKELISPRLDVTANVLHRLITYRLEYTEVVDRTIKDPSWIDAVSSGSQWAAIRKVIGSNCAECWPEARQVQREGRTWYIPSWWDEFANKVGSAIKSGAGLGTADEDPVLDQSSIRAFGCVGCTGNAPVPALRAYRKLITQRITRAMSDVFIDTGF